MFRQMGRIAGVTRPPDTVAVKDYPEFYRKVPGL